MINTVTYWLTHMYRDDRIMLGCLGTMVVCVVACVATEAIGRKIDARRSSYWSRMQRRADRSAYNRRNRW